MIVIIVGGAIIVAAIATTAVLYSEQSRELDSEPWRAWPLETDGLDIPAWVNYGDDWRQWEDELA